MPLRLAPMADKCFARALVGFFHGLGKEAGCKTDRIHHQCQNAGGRTKPYGDHEDDGPDKVWHSAEEGNDAPRNPDKKADEATSSERPGSQAER